MPIYLHYLTKDDTRMTRDACIKICAMFGWNTLAIQAFFIKDGWVFDEDYGFSWQDIVDQMHRRFDMKIDALNPKMAGFNEPCEGRR